MCKFFPSLNAVIAQKDEAKQGTDHHAGLVQEFLVFL